MSIESSKLVVKFYVDESSNVKPEEMIPVFHSWIQSHAVADHTLIDVADYAHVPDGPGALLVAHEANIYFDDLDGKLGLTYSRKLPIDASATERLRYVFRAALEACAMLEDDANLAGRIRFRTDRASFKINDRLLAPNTAMTFESLRPELQRFLTELYGTAVRLEHHLDAKRLFEVSITAASAQNLRTLLGRMPSAQPVA